MIRHLLLVLVAAALCVIGASAQSPAATSKQLLINSAQETAQNIHELGRQWRREEGSIATSMAMESVGIAKATRQAEKDSRKAALTQKYTPQATPLMTQAATFQKQLLRLLPKSARTSADTEATATFAKGEIRPLVLMKSGDYLFALAKRVAEVKP